MNAASSIVNFLLDDDVLKVEDFNDIAGLEDVLAATGGSRTSIRDCTNVIGLRFIEKPETMTMLEVFIQAGFVESRSRFKKNPTQMRVNGRKVQPNDVWNFGIVAVLCFGKNRNEASVIWFRKCTENEDGSVRKLD